MQIAIHLPGDVECLLKSGQKVDFKTPFFKKKARTISIISVSGKLGIPPKKIFSYLKKFVGDRIDKGTVVAIKKEFLSQKQIVSACQGVIKEINHEEGKIMVESLKDSYVVSSYFKGEVSSIKNDQIHLQVARGSAYDLKQVTVDFGGPSYYATTLSQLGSQHLDKIEDTILVCESLTPYLQTKMEALGVKGIITLKKLNEKTNLPTAGLKIQNDLNKIFADHFSYCLVDQSSSKMYCYE